MAKELFNFRELVQPLTPPQRLSAVKDIVRSAQYGIKYTYTMKEAAGILHWSKDQVYDALYMYKIDGFRVLSIIRIAWWSLAEYLLDPAEDVDFFFDAMIKSLPKKKGQEEGSAQSL